MKRTIIIHTDEKEHEIPVKASMAALAIYRQEFSGDLIKDLNEVYQALHPDPFADALKKIDYRPGEMDDEALKNALLSNVDYRQLSESETLPDGELLTKALQVVWAMAKAADKGLESFGAWCESFDLLPVKGIVERCNEIWTAANRCTVELKN